MSRIAFFEIKNWEKNYLKRKLPNSKIKFFKEIIDINNVSQIKDTEVLSIFIYSKVTKQIIQKLPKLKLICTRSTGIDHIDLDYCKKKGIMVCNVPTYGSNTVAEHTFALILSLSRNIHKSYVRILKENYSIDGLSGFDLNDKTIGIIGGGQIGLHVARIAKGFGMHVRIFDVNVNSFLAEVMNFKYVSLDELLKISDIVTLHAPYNKNTHHILSKESFNKMKKGAILINTSRGGLVDTDALIEALESKKLQGAALDVIEGEEFIKEEHQLLHNNSSIDNLKTIIRGHKLFKMENVVFTMHNAFNSKESLLRILDTTINNILDCPGKNCKNFVNK